MHHIGWILRRNLFLLLASIQLAFLCYVLSILGMINGEWLVLFTLIWTSNLHVYGRGSKAASRKHCVKSDHKRNSLRTFSKEKCPTPTSIDVSKKLPSVRTLQIIFHAKNSKKWLSRLFYKLKLTTGTTDSWVSSKLVKIPHDAGHKRHLRLQSKEANNIYLNANKAETRNVSGIGICFSSWSWWLRRQGPCPGMNVDGKCSSAVSNKNV